MMPDFDFYTGTYVGQVIPEGDFLPCLCRAQAVLEHFDRVYRVEGGAQERKMALCAMAETLYHHRNRRGMVKASAGSVSVTYETQAHVRLWRELYDVARCYLKICRGVAV